MNISQVLLAIARPEVPGDGLIQFMQKLSEAEARLGGTLLHLAGLLPRLVLAAAGAWFAVRVVVPAVVRRLWPRKMVGLKLVPPPGVPLDAEAWCSFFRSLRATTPPGWKRWLVGSPWITFEYRESAGLLTTTCWCPARAQGLFTACLRAALPGIEVTQLGEAEAEALPELPAARGRLAAWRDPVYPLGQPRSDPLTAAVEALALVPAAVLQVAISHEVGWEARSLKRLDELSGYHRRPRWLVGFLLEPLGEVLSIFTPGTAEAGGGPDAARARLRRTPSFRATAPSLDKALAPAWRTEVRLCAWSPAKGQAKQCALAVAGAFHALDGENQLRSRRVLYRRGFDQALRRRAAPRGACLLLSAQELAWFFHLPVVGARMEVARVSLAPLHHTGPVVGSVLCHANGTARPVRIAQPDRRQHASILGPTGSGKSALILNLVLQDAEAA
jgi:hypothetical protein